MMYRLEPHPQEWIDRSTLINFTFEGRRLPRLRRRHHLLGAGRRGVPYLGRSFKYHRPRGILSFANHDSNALFQVDGVPNVRGDVTLLREGMRVAAVNTFGGLDGDKARILDRFARWLPVGLLLQGVSFEAPVSALGAHVPRASPGLGAVDARAPSGD